MASKLSPNGGTFAERTAAAAGKASFTDPTPDPEIAPENSSFAERAKKTSKAVSSGDAEDKSVKSASKKTAAKS